MSKPRAIAKLLTKPTSGVFETTIQRSKQLSQLWQQLKILLDAELATHCQLLNVRDNQLVLACDSTVWATRLRYQIPTLLNVLREIPALEFLKDIQIKIQPVAQVASQAKKKATISSHGAYCLKQCADTITDTALRNALERLATHHRRDEQ